MSLIHQQLNRVVRLLGRVRCDIGQNDHGGLQTLCAVDGHNPDLLAAAIALAFDFGVATVKPCDELLQTPAVLLFKLQRGVQHFLNGYQYLIAQPRAEFTPRADGTGQYVLEEMIDSRKIGHRQHVTQRCNLCR